MSKKFFVGRFGRVTLTALTLSVAGLALTAGPLVDVAFANNAGGNGGGHGGGNGGGHGGGNSGDHGNSGGGNGAAHGGGQGKAAHAETADTDADDGDETGEETDDGSLAPNHLGKLNGFMNASPEALANASPNSAIGRISKTFADALRDFSAANSETPGDPDAPPAGDPSTAPTAEDLGKILADATNKPVTAEQVEAIADRLADVTGDPSLGDLADTDAQAIADAANAERAGETTDADPDAAADTTAN
jgi:hypothetical protein